ncbi:MAG: hypothetical protein LBS10_03175 [Gracilibacteraceae bacterium]|jgi:hypothetical protein|nr:hypothetical protein [Gracilibacteraceae bacterium]
MKEEASGGIAFYAMIAVLIVMVVCTMICPLVISGFSRQPYAIPMMGIALALPFIHFFIFGGSELARRKK